MKRIVFEVLTTCFRVALVDPEVVRVAGGTSTTEISGEDLADGLREDGLELTRDGEVLLLMSSSNLELSGVLDRLEALEVRFKVAHLLILL
jgi:hypothetical protein